MASAERFYPKEDKSLWRKSTAVKIGAGMVLVGAFFSLPVAAIGLGVIVGSAVWWKGIDKWEKENRQLVVTTDKKETVGQRLTQLWLGQS